MKITVEKTPLPGLLIVSHEVFEDSRGFFMEAYRQDIFAKAGLPDRFVQFNHSQSIERVIRGLHFQWDPPMGKLMRVTRGTAFVVAVDIRRGSPALGKWFGVTLTENDKKQVWGPAGFARGFCALSPSVEVQYLCTGMYNPPTESGIRWDDPEIGINWPVSQPIISAKDAAAQTLAQWLASEHSGRFTY